MLLLALLLALAAGAFWGGFELGRAHGADLCAAPSQVSAQVSGDPLTAELGLLRAEVSELRQQGSLLERTRQIEQEANRSLQDQLKAAQSERLTLVKEASYLKRLIQEGGKGAVRVHDLRLTAGTEPDTVGYAFTVTQLIPGHGASRGRIRLVITGVEGDVERALTLDQLPAAEPRYLVMDFEHFQGFEGTFRLPSGFIPRQLAVTLDPEGEQLGASTETFPWVLTGF